MSSTLRDAIRSLPASLFYVPLITLLVTLLYGINLERISVRGEESRRGRTAWEMIEYNDWVVPRLQGEPRLTRPPFSFWMIAASYGFTGEVDAFSIRLPSVLAVLLTTLVLYAYTANILNPTAGLFAAIAYMTFGQVIQLGRLGESEAIFTALMGASLLTAHLSLRAAMMSQTPSSQLQTIFSRFLLPLISGVLAALAALTKGLQAPIYFFGTIFAYLALGWLIRTGNPGRLSILIPSGYKLSSFSIENINSRTKAWATSLALALMCTAFALTFLAWLIPFSRTLGPSGIVGVGVHEIIKHVKTSTLFDFYKHILEFPIELFLACLLPWSLLIPALFEKKFLSEFLRSDNPTSINRRDVALFAIFGFAVAFPTVWFPEGGNTRYLMPVYPLMAILTAVILDIIVSSPQLAYLWRRFSLIFSVIALLGLVLAIVSVTSLRDLDIPFSPWTIATIVLSVPVIFIFYKARDIFSSSSVQFQVLTATAFLVVVCHGPFTDVLNHRRLYADQEVAFVTSQLPKSTDLVSIGLTHHLFSFYYADRIQMLDSPVHAEDFPPGSEYFCFLHRGADKQLPAYDFPYEIIATVNCDRKKEKTPHHIVVVAKRLDPNETTTDLPQVASASAAKWLQPSAFPIDDRMKSDSPFIHRLSEKTPPHEFE